MADGKVTYEYTGDLSGIDKANKEAEEKLKQGGEAVESEAKKAATNAANAYKSVGEGIKGTSDVSKTLSAELEDVNRLLRLDPKNADLVHQKFDVLKESVSSAKDKLSELKAKQDQMAQDLASGKISGKEYREYQRNVSDAEQAVKSLEKQQNAFEKSNGTFGEKIKASLSSAGSAIKENLGNAAGVALGTASAALTGFTKNGLELAKNLTEVQNVVDTTFTSNSEAINKWSENAGKQFGIGELDAKRYTSTIGAMFKSMGLGQKDVVNMSEGITGLAGDMASFYNLDPAEAFEKLRAGISGETMPLKQLGINMDETNLKAFALKEGIKQPYKEMSQSQQTMLRYQYLLSVTKDAQGDYAKTANSAANQQRTLKMEYEEISAKVGSALLPVLTKALELAQKIIIPISDFVSAHPKLSAAIVGITIVFGGLIGGMTILSGIMPVLTMLFPGLGAAGGAAGAAISTGFLPVLAVIAIIGGVIAATVLLVTHWSQISKAAQAAGNAIKNAFAGLGDWFKSVFTAAVNGIKSAWSGITGFFNSVVDGIKSAWNGLISFFVNLGTTVSNAFIFAFNGIKSWLNSFWGAITSIITGAISGIGNFIKNTFGAQIASIKIMFADIQRFFIAAWSIIKEIFLGAILLIIDLLTGNFKKLKEDFNKLVDYLTEDFQDIWDNITDFISRAIGIIASLLQMAWNNIKNAAVTSWNAIAAFFVSVWTSITNGITSFWNSIPGFFANLWNGIASTATSIWESIISFFSSLPGRIGNIMNSVGNWVQGVWNGLIGFLSGIPGRAGNALSGIGNAIKGAFQSAIGFITSLPSQALKWGRDIIDGIVNGIKSAVSHVRDAVSGVANNIRSFLHFSQPDEGPLREFPEWPRDMMKTWGEELSGNDEYVMKAVRKVTGNISASVQFQNPAAGITSPTMAAQRPTIVVNSAPAVNSMTAPMKFYNNFSVGKEVVTEAVTGMIAKSQKIKNVNVQNSIGSKGAL